MTSGAAASISTASVAGLAAGYRPHVYAVTQGRRDPALALSRARDRAVPSAGQLHLPGRIATPLVMGERTMEDVEKTFIHFQPLRRSGMPEDIGNAAMWLASDDSRFVTGHAMVVDGGLTAGTIWSQQPEIFRTHAGMMLRPDAK